MGVLIIHSKKHGTHNVLFDDQDRDLIMTQNSWVLHKRQNTFYAFCQVNGKHGRKKIYMHRLIMGFPNRKEVDHKDGDGLNNRRRNLRIASVSENKRNQIKRINNTSGFKGVNLARDTGRYFVRIAPNGIPISVYGFTNPIDAARKYNELAVLHFGEFAKLNEV